MASNYGTLSGDESRPQNGFLDATEHERAALLDKPKGSHVVFSRLEQHMTVNVSKSWGDLALLVCYIITGLLDSSSVQVWGSFVSMQTGASAEAALLRLEGCYKD